MNHAYGTLDFFRIYIPQVKTCGYKIWSWLRHLDLLQNLDESYPYLNKLFLNTIIKDLIFVEYSSVVRHDAYCNLTIHCEV